jgi:hypothetical protein
MAYLALRETWVGVRTRRPALCLDGGSAHLRAYPGRRVHRSLAESGRCRLKPAGVAAAAGTPSRASLVGIDSTPRDPEDAAELAWCLSGPAPERAHEMAGVGVAELIRELSDRYIATLQEPDGVSA